jgi:hypothetical protein
MSAATPFACNMNALSPGQRTRHQQLEERLRAELVSVHELQHGYAFEFPFNSPAYEDLAELTPLEHACCPFFTIAIRLEPADRLFWRLTGNEGVKQFIRAEFAEWFR